MPKPKRSRVPPTEDWQQLELLFSSSEQRVYELIRPVVLFGQSAAKRARETSIPARTLSRHAKLFLERGMASLFTVPPSPPSPRLSTMVREAIVALKEEHPPLHLREIAAICYVRYGRRPSIQTIKRILAEAPPVPNQRRYPPFHEIDDPATRRIAIIRLHAEGWNAKSIAEYLQTSRQTVHATLKRWVEEGFRGLPNKSSAPKRPFRKVNFQALTAVRRLGHNPLLGAWRVHAALRQMGIKLSPRTVGRMLALNRALYNLPRPQRQPRTKKSMPFRAGYRHQFWTVDLRYVDHQLGGGNVYTITIMENYSRAILASAISRTQNTTAFLIVLFAAIQQHGSPDGLVSDSGGVFLAKKVLEIYARLGIAKHQIDKGQPWQSYIETTFAIQRRMADYEFAKATTWNELQAAHDRWVADYNYQVHWAHRLRDDGRESPAEVLDWIVGHVWTPQALDYAFNALRYNRRLDKTGYLRFRYWRVYAEPGLERQRVAVWLYKEQLTVEFNDTQLAHYAVEYQPDGRHFRAVTDPQIYDTQYRSPQLPLWQFADDEWLKVLRLPHVRVRRSRLLANVTQELLFG
ncbi:MAG: helix-turn-helix domain-containing protein [Chloroflexota bacterium]|nr:helix-turn-helix domain-containing protein [Chloroflexota bacterium]MDQ5852622.1 helix-turn-helix domain-containing protein [Chloroflexota bacterium]